MIRPLKTPQAAPGSQGHHDADRDSQPEMVVIAGRNRVFGP